MSYLQKLKLSVVNKNLLQEKSEPKIMSSLIWRVKNVTNNFLLN